MNELPSCFWCNRPFRPRRDGGRAQRFCRPSCRRAFHAAARAWALEELAIGRMTVADLKKGLTATRALLPGTIAPAPVLLSSSDRNLDADEQGERT
jgi:hypothetical protein